MTGRPRVVVAGAGPVGLTAALGLAQGGTDVLVLEQGTELSEEHRASTIHPPTLELFDRLGVVEDILASGIRVDRLQYWERRERRLVAELDYGLIAGDTPYPFRLQCPQSVVTAILLPALERTGRADMRFATPVVDVTDHGDGVDVVTEGPGGHETLTADWLVAADGSSSTIRERLGLGFDGLTYEDRFLLVESDTDLGSVFPGMGPVAYLFDPKEWVIVMHVPGTTRVVFRLRADEDADAASSHTAVRERMARFLGADVPWELQGVSVYRVHQRVADAFRVGRVLLAGDAAHVNNPAGGMGMNSGVHDAGALVEALGSVLAGEAEDAVLDRYAVDRRDVARSLVQVRTDRTFRDLTAAEGAADERNADYARIAADPVAAREFLLRAAMLDGRLGASATGADMGAETGTDAGVEAT